LRPGRKSKDDASPDKNRYSTELMEDWFKNKVGFS
jgi:hypothetical protein